MTTFRVPNLQGVKPRWASGTRYTDATEDKKITSWKTSLFVPSFYLSDFREMGGMRLGEEARLPLPLAREPLELPVLPTWLSGWPRRKVYLRLSSLPSASVTRCHSAATCSSTCTTTHRPTVLVRVDPPTAQV